MDSGLEFSILWNHAIFVNDVRSFYVSETTLKRHAEDSLVSELDPKKLRFDVQGKDFVYTVYDTQEVFILSVCFAWNTTKIIGGALVNTDAPRVLWDCRWKVISSQKWYTWTAVSCEKNTTIRKPMSPAFLGIHACLIISSWHFAGDIPMDVLTKVISRTTDPDKMVGPEVKCFIRGSFYLPYWWQSQSWHEKVHFGIVITRYKVIYTFRLKLRHCEPRIEDGLISSWLCF